MQEVITYARIAFAFFATPGVLIVLPTSFILFAIFFIFLHGTKMTVAKVVRILVAPVLITFGLPMFVAASLTEKVLPQSIGGLVVLAPVLFEACIWFLWGEKDGDTSKKRRGRVRYTL